MFVRALDKFESNSTKKSRDYFMTSFFSLQNNFSFYRPRSRKSSPVRLGSRSEGHSNGQQATLVFDRRLAADLHSLGIRAHEALLSAVRK